MYIFCFIHQKARNVEKSFRHVRGEWFILKHTRVVDMQFFNTHASATAIYCCVTDIILATSKRS
jgi:hypothetical protein